MRTIHRDIVSALLFSKDGKLLMGVKNPDSGGVYADCWHIPGGGIDDGEDQIQALCREIQEEVGIDIRQAKLALADDQGSGETEKTLKDTGEVVLCKMKFNVYRVDLKENTAGIKTSLGDDLAKIEWVDPADLIKYKLTPPSITLFERLGLITPDLSSHGVIALIRNKAGKFLLLEDAREPMKGHWAPPHGRCETSDPSEKDGVIREVKEETGLDVSPVQVILTQPADTKVKTVSFWLVDSTNETVQLDEESSDFGWFSPAEALELQLYPGTKLFFEKVINNEIGLD
jgi:8-oxo-dGTP diphosphatase